MSPFQKETSQLIDILDEANSKIESINNPEIHWLKTKIQMDLRKHATALKMNLGQTFDGDLPRPKPAALKKVFGKEIVVKKTDVKDVNKPFHESSFEVEAKELQLRAEELYRKFLITESDQLIGSLNELEIRAVAKKAGLPVTETSPKTITTAFVDQIKEAIHKQIAATAPLDEPNSNQENVLKEVRTPEEIAVEEVRKAVDQLYADFNSIDNKDILDTYGDLEIRGLAKKAGLPVTETSPAKIDSKFLNQIKAAIKKQIEIDNIGK